MQRLCSLLALACLAGGNDPANRPAPLGASGPRMACGVIGS